MPLTRDLNKQAGVYRSQCCNYDIALIKGEKFPFCIACHAETRWQSVRPVVSANAIREQAHAMSEQVA